VLHTLNPRLHPDQVVYIADHAEDQILFFDLTFLPLIEAIAARVKTIRHFVAMTDRAHMPAATKVPNLLCYEELVAANSDSFTWPSFDENQASSLCYTSGTTGNPKGVLYSHRSTILHTFAIALPDALNCSAKDVILPVVPMFHVNAWGLPYSVPLVGAKMVFPGPHLDGKSLYELFETERRLILTALGPDFGRIEHIGSTAVPGLAAKPILDMMAGLRTLPLGREAIAALCALGYEDLGENGIPGRHFFRKGQPRTHHLHVVEDGGDFWRDHLLFRDTLRGHPEEADAYGRLKRLLGERHREDREAYSRAKTPYIEEVLRKARDLPHRRGLRP
jgi:GrpB-like predicted nucleotidyltransferase (UPF0157 family)